MPVWALLCGLDSFLKKDKKMKFLVQKLMRLHPKTLADGPPEPDALDFGGPPEPTDSVCGTLCGPPAPGAL